MVCVRDTVKLPESVAEEVALKEALAHTVLVLQRVVLRVFVTEPLRLAERHWDCVTVPVGEELLEGVRVTLRVMLPVPLPPVAERLKVLVELTEMLTLEVRHRVALGHWLAVEQGEAL